MNFQAELLSASAGVVDGKSYIALSQHHIDMIRSFYRSLDQEARQVRFGAAVSDESIDSYCGQLDWRSTVMIGFGDAYRLLAFDQCSSRRLAG